MGMLLSSHVGSQIAHRAPRIPQDVGAIRKQPKGLLILEYAHKASRSMLGCFPVASSTALTGCLDFLVLDQLLEDWRYR